MSEGSLDRTSAGPPMMEFGSISSGRSAARMPDGAQASPEFRALPPGRS